MGLFSRKVVITPERKRELIDEMTVEQAEFWGREMIEASSGRKHNIDRANFIAQFAPEYSDTEKYAAFHKGMDEAQKKCHDEIMEELGRK